MVDPIKRRKIIVLSESEVLPQAIKGQLARLAYSCEVERLRPSYSDFKRSLSDNHCYVVAAVEVSEQTLTKQLVLISRMKAARPSIPIIAISPSMSPKLIFSCMKLGACDFLPMPFSASDLHMVLEKAFSRHISLESLNVRLPVEDDNRVQIVWGSTQKMAEVKQLVEKVAPSDVTVLITGESGTGKELIARALHQESLRKDGPFVKVNVAAIPANLLESELFGYEKGAFTGAHKNNPGKFELANYGTIMLDEVGEMDPLLQAKLLHVLQDGSITRLGGSEEIAVDTRIVATTNRNLEREVEEGRFRKDLFYRLNVISIHLPPLRERKQDIPMLVDFLQRKYCKKYNKKELQLSADTLEFMAEYNWPGNIRELENLIKKAVVYENEKEIYLELLKKQKDEEQALAFQGNGLFLKSMAKQAAREAEKRLIAELLAKNQWNRKKTARILQISYRALLYKIKEMGLNNSGTVS